jgi:hypothetical protein
MVSRAMSSVTPTPKYRSIRLLKEFQQYQVVRMFERNKHIMLFLREYGNPQDVTTYLLSPSLRLRFRQVIHLNNGEVAGLKFKFCGCNVYTQEPIVRISGRRLSEYLC